MKKVYICSPYSGPDMEENYIKAKSWCRMALMNGELPIATHVYLPQILQDGPEEKPEKRKLAMGIAMELIPKCDVLRVCGSRISGGMKQEIQRAEECGVPVEFLDERAKVIWKQGERRRKDEGDNEISRE